jgi:hypothetical protein
MHQFRHGTGWVPDKQLLNSPAWASAAQGCRDKLPAGMDKLPVGMEQPGPGGTK